MTYKKILVAVDTTDEATEVLLAAKEIAEGKKSTISVIIVVRPLADFYVNLFSVLEDDNRIGIESQIVENATKWLSDLTKSVGVDIGEVNVVIGTPAAEIKRMAKEAHIDLIVLGTHGRHGLGLMLGSTATAVLHGAPCDVLAVKVRPKGARQ